MHISLIAVAFGEGYKTAPVKFKLGRPAFHFLHPKMVSHPLKDVKNGFYRRSSMTDTVRNFRQRT